MLTEKFVRLQTKIFQGDKVRFAWIELLTFQILQIQTTRAQLLKALLQDRWILNETAARHLHFVEEKIEIQFDQLVIIDEQFRIDVEDLM